MTNPYTRTCFSPNTRTSNSPAPMLQGWRVDQHRQPGRTRSVKCLVSALSGSELGAGDVLVGTTKQDCGGSSNHSEQGQIGVQRLPRYA